MVVYWILEWNDTNRSCNCPFSSQSKPRRVHRLHGIRNLKYFMFVYKCNVLFPSAYIGVYVTEESNLFTFVSRLTWRMPHKSNSNVKFVTIQF